MYNLFLLFKIDRRMEAEYRQQITCACLRHCRRRYRCGTGAGKPFCLKYIFLAGKSVRSARRVVMKLPKEYPYQAVYEYILA